MNEKFIRFNKLENIKNKEVQSLEWVLGNKKKALDNTKQCLCRLAQERTEALAEFILINGNVLEIEDLWDARRKVELIDGKIAQTLIELKKCEMAVEKVMEELLNKHKEAKVMEKTANRFLERERPVQLANEQTTIDDIALSRYGREDIL